jgi:23S rRNA pseudouridine1911/1915/1917 synthase
VVHPGHGNYSGTLVNALAWHYRNLPLFKSEDPRPGLVHRIDKDTSGLMVVAKNEQAKTKLALQFFEKSTERRYQAMVWGIPKEPEGTVTGNIGRSLKNRQVFTVFPDGEYGKDAVTHYKILKSIGYVCMVECRLETGRTHQIRVHMKYINHPLFNDSTYGGDQILRGTTFTKYKQFVQNCFKLLPRQALHAKTLGFNHPYSGEEMVFDSELPDDMASVIAKWENYIANRND